MTVAKWFCQTVGLYFDLMIRIDNPKWVILTLWCVLEEVLKPQHIFAQNMAARIYIRSLNLDSATVPFFPLWCSCSSLVLYLNGSISFFAGRRVSERNHILAKGWELLWLILQLPGADPLAVMLWDWTAHGAFPIQTLGIGSVYVISVCDVILAGSWVRNRAVLLK